MDRDGLRGARALLADDPRTLRGCAVEVSAALAGARTALPPQAVALASALDRLRLVAAHGLDAVAEASAALGDNLETVAAANLQTETSLARAIGSLIGSTGAAG